MNMRATLLSRTFKHFPAPSCFRDAGTRALISSLPSSSSSGLIGWHLDKTTSIGTITLQSPSTYNALTVEMGQEFSALCRQIETALTLGASSETECHAVVLVGAGDDSFSAGGNIDWIRSFKNNSAHANVDLMLQFYKSFLSVRSIPVPVIAALHGPAIGAGAGLALACDLRTAAPRSRILGFNFAKLGMHSGMGSSHFLPTLAGGMSSKITEILLKGKILSGNEASELGLINVLSDHAKEAAYDLALEISKQHPVAIRTMLQTIRQTQEHGLEAAIQREALAQAVCYNRNDWGEGVNAVSSKREPVFEPYHNH